MPPTREQIRKLRAKALAYGRSLTPEEDARITAAANSDPDCPPLTEEFFRRARWFVDVHPELARKLRGRPKLEEPKVQVTLRLDADVVRAFRAKGSGWQSRMNEALAKAAKTTKRRKRA
jgi:uncharacterized protein (DUF4415 family)